MGEIVRNFLLAGENIYPFLMILALFFIGSIGSIAYAFCQRRRFISAWNEILEEVVDYLSNKGAEIIESLIEIAMISADKDSALIIGMAKKDFEDNKGGSEFYKKLLPIISVINDKNHTANLNSDYAAARDIVDEATKLIKEFSQVGDFESFSLLSVKADKIKKEISLATKNLQGILYGLKPHSPVAVE